MLINCSDTSLVYFFDSPGSDLLYDNESGLSLNQRNDAMMAITSDYGITFPMTDRGS